ncbi:MAG: hypothetical protein U0T36_13170 [Saprospiraceae bacterium]
MSKSPEITYWDDMAKQYDVLNPHGWAMTYLSPNPYRGVQFVVMHELMAYKDMVKNKAETAVEKKNELKAKIIEDLKNPNDHINRDVHSIFE